MADQQIQVETALSVAELAELLNVTPRRVRQLREDGILIARERGKIDAPHALNARLGQLVLGSKAQGVDVHVLAAAGWLTGHRGCGVGAESFTAFEKMAGRWGLSPEDAKACLLEAALVLGRAAPEFHIADNHRR